MAARLGSRARRTLARMRHAMRRLGFAVTAAVLVLGVLHAGATYVYCPSMSALLDTPCCAHAEQDDDAVSSDAPALSPDDPACCRSLSLGALPLATGSSPAGAPAPFVAALPPLGAHPTRGRELGPGLAGSGLPVSRGGVGPPRSRAPARAALMVFLI